MKTNPSIVKIVYNKSANILAMLKLYFVAVNSNN